MSKLRQKISMKYAINLAVFLVLLGNVQALGQRKLPLPDPPTNPPIDCRKLLAGSKHHAVRIVKTITPEHLQSPAQDKLAEVEAHLLLGNKARNAGDYAGANRQYRQALEIKSPAFDNSRAQKAELEKRYDEIGTQWRNEQLQLALSFKYYHHNDAGVTSAWQAVQEATTNYMNCAGSIYLNEKDAPQTCTEEKKALLNALDVLTTRRFEATSKNELKILD